MNFNAPTKSLSDYIIDDLNDYIVNSGAFTVVDRRNIETLQQELKFQMSGDVSDETAQAIGKMLGAQTIISGSITPLGKNYRFRVQATEVETAAIQGGRTVSVTEDATLAALLGDRDKSLIATNQKFAIGAQGGVMWSVGSRPDRLAEEADTWNFGALPSLYGAFAFNNYFRVKAGVNFALNNGLSSDDGNYYEYTSLDIPLIPYLLFNPITNILLRVGVGPYVSIPLTDIEKNNEKNPITNKAFFGLIGGAGVGYRIGKGNLFLDVRYQSEFSIITWERNGREEKLLIRRGLSGVFGYEYWF